MRGIWRVAAVETTPWAINDFASWWQDQSEKEYVKKIKEAVAICWAVWRNRNDFFWNREVNSNSQVLQLARQMVAQWQQAHSITVTHRNPEHHARTMSWIPPCLGSLKCNVAAALFPDKRMIGYNFPPSPGLPNLEFG